MPRVATITQPTLNPLLAWREMRIDGFEQLRSVTPTSTSEIVQTEAGPMRGRLKYATISGLSLGFGRFSRGLISRGIYSDERVTIGFLLRNRRVRSNLCEIDSVRIWSPGAEHQRSYDHGASFGAISVEVADLVRFFGPHNRWGDPSAWTAKNSFRTDFRTGENAVRALQSIMSSFERAPAKISQAEAEYWKRAILEAASLTIVDSETCDVFVSSPRRLVMRAQEYVEKSGSAPVHISELLSALSVSRRSLHRAFDEVLGIPPMTYLRQRRLCEARILLKEGARQGITIAEVAFNRGFSDVGRFSGYYRVLFGEKPSDTLRTARTVKTWL
ncbi:helix-turn-helix transcriptional regulator [Bradyrhizobium yuanmingense]|uniref:helix-turn-helix transcriptional regulator n=1 Tax=Bradyrhizobium yuanmingense TaxID=108015 RepID=UPI0023B9032D|nr:helix-turn-helix transcriptional regulator [Bradyrhizobium yuanmingense]MDF0579250.1 helix-turn-helix transcriptional regulator [Bradyrhizobium yuanmingense]